MEEEIDEEIELEKISKEENVPPKKPVKQKVTCDFKSLDEVVSLSWLLSAIDLKQ